MANNPHPFLAQFSNEPQDTGAEPLEPDTNLGADSGKAVATTTGPGSEIDMVQYQALVAQVAELQAQNAALSIPEPEVAPRTRDEIMDDLKAKAQLDRLLNLSEDSLRVELDKRRFSNPDEFKDN